MAAIEHGSAVGGASYDAPQASARPVIRGAADFSPAMLRLFLHARATHAHALNRRQCGMQATVKHEKRAWKRQSGLTHLEIDFAWMGRLLNGAKRARLWAALGHVPADHGVTLNDQGGQEQAHG